MAVDFGLCILEVEYKHEDKDKWETLVFGPFHNSFGAMTYYGTIIAPTLEFGANVTTRTLQNPGATFSISQDNWMKQFS